MEDEIASSIAIPARCGRGKKAMTVTSGPGFSLMMEHIGFAAMTETPCVFVNVQRGGPSTGLPTLPAQGDMMQARWGSHGDYEIIALCPNSPQECFDLTIKAFNLSEQYRVPVLVMIDECVGHMTEKVVIPPGRRDRDLPAALHQEPPAEYRPFERRRRPGAGDGQAGDGYRIHVTGLTHDERGYPEMTPANAGAAGAPAHRQDQARRHARTECTRTAIEDAEVVVVSYGITSRVVQRGRRAGTGEGAQVGKLRLIDGVAVPETRIRELAGRVKAFVVPELNLGQMVREVERCAGGTRRRHLACRTPAARCTSPDAFCKAIGGGAPMSEDWTIPSRSRESRRAVSPHGPDAAHLVSGLRHRHHGELLSRARSTASG